MKRYIRQETDGLQGSNGEYAYKGFTISHRKEGWLVRIAHDNEVIRVCRSLQEAMDRIDNQTI